MLSYNLEGGDPATLNDIALYEIKPVLSRVPGVGRVDVQGTDVREIEVVADPARLASLGLTYDDLAADIRQAITPEAVGRIAAGLPAVPDRHRPGGAHAGGRGRTSPSATASGCATWRR